MRPRLPARAPASWLLPVALAAAALVFDELERATPFSVAVTGLLDEPSHFATTALALLGLRRFLALPQRFVLAALISSVAIDLDHIPIYLGAAWVSPVLDGRPYTHSVATVIVLLLMAVISSRHRAVAAGATFGVVTHLIRDVCEGAPGVPLFWPFSNHPLLAGMDAFWILILASLAVVLVPCRVSARI